MARSPSLRVLEGTHVVAASGNLWSKLICASVCMDLLALGYR